MTRTLQILIPIALLLATPAAATDGAAPIWQPTTITQSGKYRVTRNIASATTPAIDIQADDVEIDLNGFTVRGGISGYGSSGVFPQPSFKIENNVIHDATSGIVVEVVAAMVRNNIIDRPTQEGIHIEECGACDIIGNVVTSSQGVGINALDGDCRLIENTVRYSAGNGIEIGFGAAQIEGNLASQNQGFGIHILGSFTVYRGNSARGNNGTGCPIPTGADFCDAGTGNTSHGDNYMPGPM